MTEQEDNKDPIARRLVAAAALITDLIGKDVMVVQLGSRPQREQSQGAAPASRRDDDETRRAGPRCR